MSFYWEHRTSNIEHSTSNEQFGFPDVGANFPLTPALSLREREELWNAFGLSCANDLIQGGELRGTCL